MNSRATASSDAHSTVGLQPIHIIGLFPELLGVGGVQEAGRVTAAAISQIVRERGGEVEFLSLNDSAGRTSFEFDGRRISIRGFGRAKVHFASSAMRLARRARKDMSVVVVAAHPHLAIPADLMRRVSPRLRVLVMTHGIDVWTALSPVRMRALRRAWLVLAPSHFTEAKVTTVQGVAPESVRVLPWPLNPEFARFASESSTLLVPRDFPIGRILLTVGRWAASERYKGADDLIRAVAQLVPSCSDLQLVAVGSGDDVPRLLRLAKSLEVAGRVHFFSGLSRAEIAACYSRADAFALPSTGEGFGLVFLEAMAFAKPVVGVAAGGAVDLIQDGVNGVLIPPHNLQKLAEAIAALLRDDSLRARMGQAGVDLVRRKYCFGAFTKQLERIFQECC
ncbi:MAG: glycosyltransferase family 4 protein [Candidatus Acidiferrales bacterium]